MDLDNILQNGLDAISKAGDLKALEDLRVHYLGKKGEFTAILKGLGSLSPEERPNVGAKVNEAKSTFVAALNEAKAQKERALKEIEAIANSADVTMPGRKQSMGSLHPVMQVKDRLEDIFVSLGFDIATGPEIEEEFYNFEALNTPEHHPARAMHDTFYLGDGRLLRSHTSPVQIRKMQKEGVPTRLIAPGRVYRRDFDVTHTPMFHQLEGLVVDKDVTFANLKHLLETFLARFFEKESVKIRLRPSYFPFTEPSAEVDLECVHCWGKGCRICGQTGWIEILGCGMVHPNVLKAVNIDSEQYQGYAFGLGIDRLAMIYYKINDLRLLFENDSRFLAQF